MWNLFVLRQVLVVTWVVTKTGDLPEQTPPAPPPGQVISTYTQLHMHQVPLCTTYHTVPHCITLPVQIEALISR